MGILVSSNDAACQMMSLFQENTIQAMKFNEALRSLRTFERPTNVRCSDCG